MRKQFRGPSKILQRLETKRENERLYIELNQIKPTMSISLPLECGHLKVNRKREQQREDRYTEIERENRMLMEKISNIMHSRITKYSPQPIKQSLNFSLRAKHQRQISIDNLSLMRRLESKKSSYTIRDLHLHQRSPEKFKAYYDHSLMSSRNPSRYLEKKGARLSPISNEVEVPVIRTRIHLDDRIFSVEVFKGKSSVKILAKDEEGSETFTLGLKAKEALGLMGGKEDWDKLVDCLHLDGNDLVLWDDNASESI